MAQNDPTNVFAAFEMLLEEIEVEIDFINQAGSKAFERSDYASVEQHRQRASQATQLRNKLVDLRKEWDVLVTPHTDQVEEATIRNERRNLGRLQRGLRTPEAAFRQPILKVLTEKGGSARMNDVLNDVEQLMKSVLKQVDYQPLPSQPDAPRWRNTAQWERDTMVKEGLLKSTSPRGVWEITEAGRKALDKSI
jgi:restriction system protein